MTDGPPRHLTPVHAGPPTDEPPYDPAYDTPRGRPPIADRDAEQALLATLLKYPDTGTDLAEELDPSDFYWPTHRQIWDTWHHLAGTTGTSPDYVVVQNALVADKAADAATTVLDLVTSDTWRLSQTPTLGPTYAGIIRDHARRRTFADTFTRGLQLVTNPAASNGHLDTYLGEALQTLDDAINRYGGTATGAPISTWAPLDLDPVLVGNEIDPPPALLARDDGQRLLYAGSVHSVSGEPGSGKTWLTLVAAVQELRAAHQVTMVDFEDRASRVVGRLLALGAHPDQIRANFRYIRPHAALDTNTRHDLEHACTGSSLIILDGVTEAMTLHGLDLSSNPDIAKFYGLLPRPLADLRTSPDDPGPAVVMIDHVVKDGEKQGRWGIGGQHKLAGIDGVSYLVKIIEPFGRGKTGHARVTVAKDRPGYIEEIAVGRTVIELHVDGTDPVFIRPHLRVPEAAPVDEAGNMRPTVLMERVCRWLEINPGANRSRILDDVTGKSTYLRRALDRLTQEGFVEVTQGPNREHFHRVITPFRNDPDEDTA